MSITRNSFQRPAALFAAAAILFGAVAPLLTQQSTVLAAGQVVERRIQLSDSSPSGSGIASGTVGSGTGVSYAVSFKTPASPANNNIGAVVVDICANSPLIGDTTCTLPTGFSWGSATPTVTNLTGLTGFTSGSMQGAGAGAATPQVLTLTNGTPQSVSASTTISFTVSGITNPDNTTLVNNYSTFYARILTFSTSANMTTHYTATGTTRNSLTNLQANAVDFGGVAMSLTRLITVTARVMERLSLCVSGGDAANANNMTAANSCNTATTPSVTLGSSPDYVLGYTGATPSTGNIYSQLSTNAANGYALYLRGSNTSCTGGNGGLSKDGGANCQIPPINSGSGAGNSTFTDNTAEFGAHVSNGVAATSGSGSNTAIAKWAGPNWVMDTTTGGATGDNIISAFGSMIASSGVQANSVNNTITFAAVASPTTPAGIYTQNFSLIGVGTF
jgi:hypothetical protein